jgi:lysophospholipase L1-like esterase
MFSVGRQVMATVLLGLAVIGCGSATPDQGRPTPLPKQAECKVAREEQPLCILVLGDSIAAGEPLRGSDRWWALLASALGSALPDYDVAVDSWAVSGSQIDVLESAARDQPALDSYQIAIVIEGVNDEATLPIDDWRKRYEAAIAAMERRGLVVVVGTPPPSFERGGFMTRYDVTAATLREVAANRRPLLDVAARWHADGAATASAYYADLIHQSAVGQRVMAEMARDVVFEAIGVR